MTHFSLGLLVPGPIQTFKGTRSLDHRPVLSRGKSVRERQTHHFGKRSARYEIKEATTAILERQCQDGSEAAWDRRSEGERSGLGSRAVVGAMKYSRLVTSIIRILLVCNESLLAGKSFQSRCEIVFICVETLIELVQNTEPFGIRRIWFGHGKKVASSFRLYRNRNS